MLIKIRRASDLRESEVTDQSVYQNRRRFMQGAVGLGLSSMLAGNSQAALTVRDNGVYSKAPASKFSTDETATPYEDVTTYNNFYELGTSKSDPAENAKFLKTKPWTLKVSGECAKPAEYHLEDFVKPAGLEERIYRLRCVEGWSMVIPWVGFPLADLIARSEPNSKAKYVAFETLNDPTNLPGQERAILDWPYKEGLRIDEAMHPLALMAVGLYGDVLPNQNGAPVRLVVPWKYGFKSIKSVVKITLVEKEPPTAWNTSQAQEYGFYSNVNPQVPHPRWSQARERRIGEFLKRDTLMFNGYGEEVAKLYNGMDLKRFF